MVLPDPLDGPKVSERMLWPRHAPEHEKARRERLHIIIAAIVVSHVALAAFLLALVRPYLTFDLPISLIKIATLLALVLLLAISLLKYGTARALTNDRIILTPHEMIFRSSCPAWLRRLLQLNWTVPWADVTAISLHLPSQSYDTGAALRTTELVLDTGTKTRKVALFHWVDVTNTQPTSIPTLSQQLRQGTIQQIQDLFLETPLLNHITELGLPFDINRQITNLTADASLQPQVVFSKFKAPNKTVLIAAIALIVYACVTYMTLPDTRIVSQGMNLYLNIIKCAWLGIVFLWPSPSITFVKRCQIAFLFWIAVELSSASTLIHLNRLLSFDTMQPYTYILQEDQYLRPIDVPELPLIEAKRAYVQHCAVGSTHTLYLQKGGLGLYVLDRQAQQRQNESSPCP